MVTAKQASAEHEPVQTIRPSGFARHIRHLTIGAGLVVAAMGIVYALSEGQHIPLNLLSTHPPEILGTGTPKAAKPAKTDMRLTREGIDLLLDSLDQAIRRKDVASILRHIALDATITIHMKQGSQQQMTTLTREEYRTTLGMGFAFPTGNDYERVNTTVTLASDERSAKVSFKSIETLRQAYREFKVEGEQTLIVRIQDDKPMIVSLEQVVPGDST